MKSPRQPEERANDVHNHANSEASVPLKIQISNQDLF